MYSSDPLTMRTALALVRDVSGILKILVDTGQTVRENDPFAEVVQVNLSPSPYATRLKLMWQNMRDDVLNNFIRTKSNLSPEKFLERMEAQHQLDAYQSLSIEGYRVTDELITKVKSGDWKPDGTDADSKNALASGGYDWLIIPVERRDEYMIALEKASVSSDIVPFVNFLSSI